MSDQAHRCPWCEQGTATESVEIEHFRYRLPTGLADLTATVFVWTCDACRMQWTDYRGEDARTAAVEAFLAGMEADGS